MWGSSVLLLKDEKNTAALHATINDERRDGKCRKNPELFSSEAKHQWTMF
jgi:hypothetical protein